MNHEARTLLTALGEDGYLAICWKAPGQAFTQHVTTLPEALATIDAIGYTADIWYGVNRMAERPPTGRGRAADVTRITCLYADLDTGKPLTPATVTEARTIIDGLPDPQFIVYSGHGLQPIWPLTGDEFTTSDSLILNRWGQLIADRSAARGWVTDNVYDLARILRVPGTINHKDPAAPVRARLELTDGVPLTYDEVTDVLNTHERDRPARAQILTSDPARPAASRQVTREWLDQIAAFQRPSSPYGAQALDELIAEYGTKEASRHRWMVRSVTRVLELAAAGHLDARHALMTIRDRFAALIAGERPALPEFIEGVAWGVGQLAPPTTTVAEPAEDPATGDPLTTRMLTGDIILDEPAIPPAVWGDGEEVAWSEGEALILAGPDGVGKTTVAGQLVRARLGIGPAVVLGMTITPGQRNLLYLMMDRPRQIRRSLRRIFAEHDRVALKERLVLWQGPPPADLARDPGMLLRLCEGADADTVVVDSLKDAALKLSDDETGAGWNRARQNVTAAGIQILELHHPRKAQSDNKKPSALEDLFGSRWISAGAGSVLMLWGKAGDPIVELIHLKQAAAEIGPWQIRIDRASGTIERDHGTDLLTEIRYRGAEGITAKIAARLIFGSENPSRADVEKARYRLDRYVSEEILHREDGPPVVWHLTQGSDSGQNQKTVDSGKDQKINKTYPPGTDFTQVAASNGLSENGVRHSQKNLAGVSERGGDINIPHSDSDAPPGTADPLCTRCGEYHYRYGPNGRPCFGTPSKAAKP